jgi:hypothetical protein
MIGKDLAAARQAWIEEAGADAEERQRREQCDFLVYEDAGGRAFYFHATRHSCITLLPRSGVHPKMAQDLARHSTIDLTMNRYSHLRLQDHAAALAALPSLLPGAPQGEAPALAASGADGPGGERELPPAYRKGEPGGDSLRVSESGEGGDAEGATGHKRPILQELAAGCESLREGWVTGLEPATFRSTV